MHTFVMVKSEALKWGLLSSILYAMKEDWFKIVAERMRWLNTQDFEFLYAAHLDKPYAGDLRNSVGRGAYLMAVVNLSPAALHVVNRFRVHLTGSYGGVALASMVKPYRERFVTNGPTPADNSLHASDSSEAAQRELEYFFPELVKELANVR